MPEVIVMVKSPSLQEDRIASPTPRASTAIPDLPAGVRTRSASRRTVLPQRAGRHRRSAPTSPCASTPPDGARPGAGRGGGHRGSPDGRRRLQHQQHHAERGPAQARSRRPPRAARARRRARSSRWPRSPRAPTPTTYGTSHQRRQLAREPLLGRRSLGRQPRQGHRRHPLSSEFVEEVNVVTAGYMPEFGRSTGGVLNVVTKSGLERVPRQRVQLLLARRPRGHAQARARARAARSSTTTELSYIGDVGFDLGGPIIKDKLWFYVGFDIAQTNVQRRSRHLPHQSTTNGDDAMTSTRRRIVLAQRFDADARTCKAWPS